MACGGLWIHVAGHLLGERACQRPHIADSKHGVLFRLSGSGLCFCDGVWANEKDRPKKSLLLTSILDRDGCASTLTLPIFKVKYRLCPLQGTGERYSNSIFLQQPRFMVY